MEVHEFKPFKPNFDLNFRRADIEIYGIDHFRPSYTGLIFFNVKKINAKKLKADDSRCVGRFSVFGHEHCAGDKGHCSSTIPNRFAPRRSHPLTRAFKRITVTDALRSALEDDEKLKITIVVSDGDGKKKKKKKDIKSKSIFSCEGLQVVTFA